MNLAESLERFQPFNEQEAADKEKLLYYLEKIPDIFFRENGAMHMTASAWVVNPDRSKVLMVYHNIYDSWSWLGGHADGNQNLLEVALREVQEESGVKEVRPLSEEIFSVEILTVDGHWKRGKYVSSHLHLNVTYLLEADDRQDLTVKPDENKGVKWFPCGDALAASSEPWFREHVYKKLNRKLELL